MSDRVVFIPHGVAVPFAFSELGRGTAGAWGMVQDGPWLAAGGAGDPLELLYLSPVEYHHAVRGLPPDEVAAVVERRRDTFAHQLPSLALGLIELQVRGCFALFGDNARERQACADLLVALASFTSRPPFLRDGARRVAGPGARRRRQDHRRARFAVAARRQVISILPATSARPAAGSRPRRAPCWRDAVTPTPGAHCLTSTSSAST